MKFFTDLKTCILHPADFYHSLASKEDEPLTALGILMFNSAVLLVAVFGGYWILGSDIIASFLNYQINTFVVQEYTSLQFFGYYIPNTMSVISYLDGVLFLVKLALCIMVLLWGLLRLLKEKAAIAKIFATVAWSSCLFLPLAVITVAFWGLRFLFPIYYDFVYYGILFVILIVIWPIYVIVGLGESIHVSFYKRSIVVAGIIFILFLLWTFNHADILLDNPL